MKQNAIIFGDSYSTFRGFVPEGYAIYYTDQTPNGTGDTGVVDVAQTWWHMVVQETGIHLAMNNSWSGSTIGYTGYNNSDCSASSSFIYRLRQLIHEDFFAKNHIDTVFVFGGTNDSWSDAPLGEAKFDNWKEEDLYCVLPAVCYFLHLLRKTLPQANIYCLINTELKDAITDGMKAACTAYNVTPVTFDSIDKSCGHPTVQGMKDIKAGVLNAWNR